MDRKHAQRTIEYYVHLYLINWILLNTIRLHMCRSALNQCARSIYLQSLLSPSSCTWTCTSLFRHRYSFFAFICSCFLLLLWLWLLLHVLHDAVRMCWCSLQLALSKLMHNDSRIHHWLWHLIAFFAKAGLCSCSYVYRTCFMSLNYMQFFRRPHHPPRSSSFPLSKSACVFFHFISRYTSFAFNSLLANHFI